MPTTFLLYPPPLSQAWVLCYLSFGPSPTVHQLLLLFFCHFFWARLECYRQLASHLRSRQNTVAFSVHMSPCPGPPTIWQQPMQSKIYLSGAMNCHKVWFCVRFRVGFLMPETGTLQALKRSLLVKTDRTSSAVSKTSEILSCTGSRFYKKLELFTSTRCFGWARSSFMDSTAIFFGSFFDSVDLLSSSWAHFSSYAEFTGMQNWNIQEFRKTLERSTFGAKNVSPSRVIIGFGWKLASTFLTHCYRDWNIFGSDAS